MTLSGRFSTLFLAFLAASLLGFASTLYVLASDYLHRDVTERLEAALDTLAAAGEVHPDSVEWEPGERLLPVGLDSGPAGVRWVIHDPNWIRVDRSRNLGDLDLAQPSEPEPAGSGENTRERDDQGEDWLVASRRIRPGVPVSGSQATAEDPGPPVVDLPASLYPELVITAYAPLGPAETTLRALAGSLVGLTATTWLLAAALCRRLSRRALKPLERLVESARSLDPADVGWELELAGTRDELDELGAAFNVLLARVGRAFERERRFAGDASHQLRTPLTILMGQLEVALLRERSSEEYRRVIDTALGRATHLAEIVEALLVLSRGADDTPVGEMETLELGSWVESYLERRSSASGCATGEVASDAGGPCWVRACPTLLAVVLDNLVDNAEKHGGLSCDVSVRVAWDGEFAGLMVCDGGSGIEAAEAELIFEPFYRTAETRRRGVAGAGLGLSVARRIAMAMGGKLTYRSSARGTCFELRLPRLEMGPAEPLQAASVAEASATGHSTRAIHTS